MSVHLPGCRCFECDDPVAELSSLLREAGARVTLDPKRTIMGPCEVCGTTKEPRDLVTIGTYTRPMGGNIQPGDPIDRPMCERCERLTTPPRSAT